MCKIYILHHVECGHGIYHTNITQISQKYHTNITQISYNIIQYHTISHNITQYHTISHNITQYHTISHKQRVVGGEVTWTRQLIWFNSFNKMEDIQSIYSLVKPDKLIPVSRAGLDNKRWFEQGAECKVQSAKCRVQSAECKVQTAKCRVQSAECRVLLSNFTTLQQK